MKYFNEENNQILIRENLSKVNKLSRWLWGNIITSKDIDLWLKNYIGECLDESEEKVHSTYLLSQFMFFNIPEVRKMLIFSYKELFYKVIIREIRKDGENSISAIEQKFNAELAQTRFLGIGNASESSCLMLYFFRQENELAKELFWNISDVFDRENDGKISGLKKSKDGLEIKNYIFLDDISSSGHQAQEFFEDNNFEKIYDYNTSAKIHYFTLMNTNESRSLFKEKLPSIVFKTVFELNETYQVFNQKSRYFPKNKTHISLHLNMISESKRLCERYYYKYGLNSGYKCGYDNSQLLMGFFYNTPDNSLPFLWAKSNNWYPVIKRYHKKYNF
jgi:hypothetical protein